MYGENEKKRLSVFRVIILIMLALAASTLFVIRLVDVQIVNGEMYYQKSRSSVIKKLTATASRGEILDRNGVPLVSNRMGCCVVLNAAEFPSAQKNDDINNLLTLLLDIAAENDESYAAPTLMNYENESFTFADVAEAAALKTYLKLNGYATAQNCFDALVEKYGLSGFSPETALALASVRYGMENSDFSVKYPYTFAQDVSENTVSKIKENSTLLPGVEIEVKPYREYFDGTLAPHVLGTVGSIDRLEYEEKKESGYLLNDEIGKSGIELSMEDQLRGVTGEKTVTTDYLGNVTTEYTKLPVQGNTVTLTLDAGLQNAARNALKKRMAELGALDPVATPATAGAVCVTEVGTGNILAMVSEPGYDASSFAQQLSALTVAEGSPLWNRATLSAYAPGSTFKPAIALGALTEGIINESTTITCRRRYTYFGDITFTCLSYHGSLNVVGALQKSCNVFFYETGRRMGIELMNKNCSLLGLGEYTNIEIEETKGTLAGPHTTDGVWTGGSTVQAAIGQANNAFTPIQLTMYVEALANGGKRHEAHLVQRVTDYNGDQTILEKEPVVMFDGGFSAENIDIVRNGMKRVVSQGSTSKLFDPLGVVVAAKTGTAQIGDGATNACFITFAPADSPEIAIGVVVEGGGSGTAIAAIAADIYAYWFNTVKTNASIMQCGTLLK